MEPLGFSLKLARGVVTTVQRSFRTTKATEGGSPKPQRTKSKAERSVNLTRRIGEETRNGTLVNFRRHMHKVDFSMNRYHVSIELVKTLSRATPAHGAHNTPVHT